MLYVGTDAEFFIPNSVIHIPVNQVVFEYVLMTTEADS